MEKSSQYIPNKGQPTPQNHPAPVQNNTNEEQQQNLSPRHYFDLGYYGPLTWSKERLINATLPFQEWVKKNPGKNQWDYQKEKETLYKGHFNWLQWLLIPPQFRKLITKFRRV